VTPRWRLVRLLVGALLAVALAPLQAASGGEWPGYEQLRAAADTDGLNARRCPDTADAFGQWVAHLRDTGTGRPALLQARKLGEQIHSRCREGIRQLESATNEDEGALEALYRSELWYDINRALAALRYWQAWLDLSLAQYADAASANRVTDVARVVTNYAPRKSWLIVCSRTPRSNHCGIRPWAPTTLMPRIRWKR
jgi:hypothetical protein